MEREIVWSEKGLKKKGSRSKAEITINYRASCRDSRQNMGNMGYKYVYRSRHSRSIRNQYGGAN